MLAVMVILMLINTSDVSSVGDINVNKYFRWAIATFIGFVDFLFNTLQKYIYVQNSRRYCCCFETTYFSQQSLKKEKEKKIFVQRAKVMKVENVFKFKF
jgi:hypothetical protein